MGAVSHRGHPVTVSIKCRMVSLDISVPESKYGYHAWSQGGPLSLLAVSAYLDMELGDIRLRHGCIL